MFCSVMRARLARPRGEGVASRALRACGYALLLALGGCRHSPPSASRSRDLSASIVVSGRQPAPERLRRTVPVACRDRTPNGCDVRDEPCQRRLFELARCLAGRDGTRPPLRFVSEVEARRRLAVERARTTSVQAGLEEAVSVLGLGRAPPSTGASDRVPGVGPDAYYEPRERSVFFVTGEAMPYDGELPALSIVHEYVHAIQDRDGELSRAENDQATQSFDERLTLWSAFEGEATLYEEVVRAFIHGLEPETWVVARFAARTGGSDDAIVRQGRPLEASLATFPYSYGAYWAALETARPASTYELLGRRHEWPPAGAERCDDESPPSLAPNYLRRHRDTLGAWLLQSYVRKLSGDPVRARAAARHWRGDWLSLYSRKPGGPWSLVWQTCWDSLQATGEMRELIATALHKSAGNRATVTQNARRVTAAVRDEGLAEVATTVH
jgi:hypothetical protein